MVFRKNRCKKAQSAVEYIFIVALALMLIIPGTIIFYQYSQASQKAIVSSQVYKIGSDLVGAAHSMYSVGENSWQTLEISFPSSIHEVKVYNASYGGVLVIRHGTDYVSDAVFFSRVHFLNNTLGDDCSAGCILPVNKGFTKIRVFSQRDGYISFGVVS
jgi:hypothetical protein